MKDNLELERSDLAVDRDMEVDSDLGQQITVYLEVWFDARAFFSRQMDTTDVEWFDMYGKLDPYKDTLYVECEAHYADGKLRCFDYAMSEAEAKLIKNMITEKLMEVYGQTPKEFCESISDPEISMGGIQ